MNKVWLFCLLFFSLGFTVYSQADQHQIDSLNKIAEGTSHDTIKFQALSDLNWIYSMVDPNKAKTIGYREMQLASQLKPVYKAQACNDIAIAFLS